MAANNRSTADNTPRELIALDFRDPDVEETLLELLALARTGELQGIVFAGRMERGASEPFLFGSTGRLRDNQAEGIGAAVLLQHRLAAM